MKEYTEVLTFFFMNIQRLWKFCQSNSLLQVALCQYFNIAINGMKFFFILLPEMKVKLSFIQMMPLLLWVFSASRECMWNRRNWMRYGKNGSVVPDNINLLFTDHKGYTEKYWPEVVIPLGISNYNFSWSGHGFLLEPYNSVLWIGKLIFLNRLYKSTMVISLASKI